MDPAHRSCGKINDTAGDGLMIIFQNFDQMENAVYSIRAAFEIFEKSRDINTRMKGDFEPVAVYSMMGTSIRPFGSES